ncbi:MAG: Uma2 family endonuclease [Isosphaeraceae bacterium]|nr:Uma2 family endonuclease [Isosphaeraceae bacterium]
MATEARKKRAGDRGRVPYRFNAAQVLKMIDSGILGEGDDVELWDGVLYRMVKKELHNYVVSQTADALRPLTPAGYHVREEKSCKYAERSLPEPDVAVARGRKDEYLPEPPHLARLALVVEVNYHTDQADYGEKLRRYAEVGIPIYWLIDVKARIVRVYEQPRGSGAEARYAACRTYEPGAIIAVVIDGRPVGHVAVADLLPPERHPKDGGD